MPSNNPQGYDTPESGFLYKPVADNGGLVILLPSKYRQSSVRLIDPNGNEIEQGRSTGYANGDREHFRFSQDGGQYPDGSVVEVTTSDGQVMKYQVGNTSARWDFGSGGGGTVEGGSGVSPTAAAFLGGSSLNIQRPGGAFSSFSDTPDSFMFESPLSTIETIRNVSNIIVGASKSFDTLTNLSTSTDSLLSQSLPETPELNLMSVPGNSDKETGML